MWVLSPGTLALQSGILTTAGKGGKGILPKEKPVQRHKGLVPVGNAKKFTVAGAWATVS